MVKIGDIKYGGELGYKDSAKWMWSACPECGKERWVQLRKGVPQYILCQSCVSKKRIGITSHNWKGGRFKRVNYWMTRVYPDDFFYPMASRGSGGYVLEHRLVIAKHLNRCLLPWEVVHHKNGIRDDNRFENLELLPNRKLHLPDTVIKRYIKQLEKRIELLEKEVLSLKGGKDSVIS